MFLGAPASGKGTQGEIAAKKLSVPLISTGAMLRREIADKSELGVKSAAYIEKGDLVPDDLVLEMVAKRLKESDCENGFLLDGFPRTLGQAKALDEMGVGLDKIISLEVSEDEIIKRITGRRLCKDCPQTFHTIFKPPKKEDTCDDCGGELFLRSDDSREVAKERLVVYNELTAPLKDYYRSAGILFEVDGSGDIEEISLEIDRLLNIGET